MGRKCPQHYFYFLSSTPLLFVSCPSLVMTTQFCLTSASTINSMQLAKKFIGIFQFPLMENHNQTSWPRPFLRCHSILCFLENIQWSPAHVSLLLSKGSICSLPTEEQKPKSSCICTFSPLLDNWQSRKDAILKHSSSWGFPSWSCDSLLGFGPLFF